MKNEEAKIEGIKVTKLNLDFEVTLEIPLNNIRYDVRSVCCSSVEATHRKKKKKKLKTLSCMLPNQ